ncbi:spike protein [Miniopterus bat coronavirus HKU8]|uniref:Spike protein n=1 Tax=Miniopterus bat coronavirus HKU8 TaxID=694001 RepID=B1PHK2_9ALPC|nr:spike protein [Miniopterus bat coronavirus HKU8]ACA52171.1 spike protein [Miniopterus bat coronavirus HKU8]
MKSLLVLSLLALLATLSVNAQVTGEGGVAEGNYWVNASCAGWSYFYALKLGLPPNASAIVTGYLPKPKGWICPRFNGAGIYTRNNANAVFVMYRTKALAFEIGVSSSAGGEQYSAYMAQQNGKYLVLRICKWQNGTLAAPTLQSTSGKDCIVNVKVDNHMFYHAAHDIVGMSWSGDAVRLYTQTDTKTYYIPNSWDRVSIRCPDKFSCSSQIVTKAITVNVTTFANGTIDKYAICDNCNGYPAHIFPVSEGGLIPADFNFSNWFLLTNSSTIVDGRIVSEQPVLLMCLWAVPGLMSTNSFVYFNGTAPNKQCNGYATDSAFEALRFSLNFTDERVFAGSGSVVLLVSGLQYKFSCTNNSEAVIDSGIPFGNVVEPFYCFVSINGTSIFVGMLPAVLREIVITRYGSIYLNGFSIFQGPPIQGVLFNVTNRGATDLWTVALSNFTEVLAEVQSTAIKALLYCDDPLSQLKCQQLQFSLPDGFYATASLFQHELPRTFVTLPRHFTHSWINLRIKWKNGVCYNCPPASSWIDFVTFNSNGTENVLPERTLCVNTTQFTTNLTLIEEAFSYSTPVVVRADDCPFDFQSLNNYLTFGSICFSLNGTIGKGCTLGIYKRASSQYIPIWNVWVAYTSGDNILGVREPNVGVRDQSVVHQNVCTSYTIFGHSGRGIIRPANISYIAGVYYTAASGQLLGFKNTTTGEVFSVTPCNPSQQAVVVKDRLVGVMSSTSTVSIPFNNTIPTPSFYYHSNATSSCDDPSVVYSSIGICDDGGITFVNSTRVRGEPDPAISMGNISVPSNFTVSIQVEYLQMSIRPVSIDCAMYVCNGNPHCTRLLQQYISACRTIEEALQLSARLESFEVNSMLTVSETALDLVNISTFGGDYNLTALLPQGGGKRSVIEDILFDKVVTSGLGTVDEDYKRCTNGIGIADVPCAQYYNGIMVLPGVVDEEKMSIYTASLLGGMTMGGFTPVAALPFALSVQSRLNYVALQTDVLQKNQQILANAFNSAIGNITVAFDQVTTAVQQTSDAIKTVASALNKVQSVVNSQGQALHQLTKQLASNFQAISASIEDIYNRLDGLAADANVDRLITGRLAALNAFVTQTLTKYTEVRASRLLAQEKINECVKSQSTRYGFCGNGTHLFSIPNAAPEGIMLFHTVLVPTEYVSVTAWSGYCHNGVGYAVKDVGNSLFQFNNTFYITPRNMYQPRTPTSADFIRISGCNVVYVNITDEQLPQVQPEFIDVNKTLEELMSRLPNNTGPNLPLDIFNQTYLNISAEIDALENKSLELQATADKLQLTIEQLNATLVDLEWLNRFEQYVKWPWWVWLTMIIALVLLTGLMLWCCLATGCCGCCSCMASTLDFRGSRLQQYEVEKVHIQ